jgi:uncharacterized integral membrane protein (TIGR00697 family)
LYCAVILGIVLGNLQGGKVSELTLFGMQFNVSMGAILYSGIYFATDLLNEKFGKDEANRAVMLGFVANIAVMLIHGLSFLEQLVKRGQEPKSKLLMMMGLRLNLIIKAQSL